MRLSDTDPTDVDFDVAGVIDPARYSANAVVVVEVDAGTLDGPEQLAKLRVKAEKMFGMRVVVLQGARVARIEGP